MDTDVAETRSAPFKERIITEGDPRLAWPNGDGSTPSVSVVIPALNEERSLPHVLADVPDEYECVVVDGNSSDDTAAVARRVRPDAHVLHQTGRGKSNALLEGFRRCTGDIIVMLDADGSTDPKEIPRFVEALQQGADFAKGSRFLDGGGSVDITPLRRLGVWGLSQIVNVLFRARYTDLCYGYNAFWARCLPVLELECEGFEIEALMNVRVLKLGLEVAEVPSFESARIHGDSNFNTFRDGSLIARLILRERFGAWRSSRRPAAARSASTRT